MTTDGSIRLCAVRAADSGARLLLELSHCEEAQTRKETLCVFAKRLQRVPVVGPVSPDTYANFLHEAAVCEAVTLGLRLLAYGALSRVRLIQKLRARGLTAAAASEAADLLVSDGFLNESEGALSCARADLAKLWGDKRILADLAAKGFDRVALNAVKEMLSAENSQKRCAKLIQKRRMRLPRDEAEAARFAAALMRYGYSVSEMKAAFEILSRCNGK